MATKKLKSKTMAAVPQSKDDCAAAIRTLGDLVRSFERQRAEMNDAIAAIAEQHQPVLSDLQEQITALRTGIQAWCEAHRVQLCGEDDKLGKTANLVTGEVSWRQRPPSVSIRGAETVLETLERMRLTQFIRTRSEPNKEAMLAEPDLVRGIAGITIVTGVEDFTITPFEAEAEVTA
jgi:phage host-nuclease inhibitor protein Gam